MVPTSHIYHYTHFRWVGTTNYAPEADCPMLLSVRCPRIQEKVKCWCEPGVMWTQSWNISLNGDIKYFANLQLQMNEWGHFEEKLPFWATFLHHLPSRLFIQNNIHQPQQPRWNEGSFSPSIHYLSVVWRCLYVTRKQCCSFLADHFLFCFNLHQPVLHMVFLEKQWVWVWVFSNVSNKGKSKNG